MSVLVCDPTTETTAMAPSEDGEASWRPQQDVLASLTAMPKVDGSHTSAAGWVVTPRDG